MTHLLLKRPFSLVQFGELTKLVDWFSDKGELLITKNNISLNIPQNTKMQYTEAQVCLLILLHIQNHYTITVTHFIVMIKKLIPNVPNLGAEIERILFEKEVDQINESEFVNDEFSGLSGDYFTDLKSLIKESTEMALSQGNCQNTST